jgi:signal transduction histidine kinase
MASFERLGRAYALYKSKLVVSSQIEKETPQFVRLKVIPIIQIVSNFLANAVKYSLDDVSV